MSPPLQTKICEVQRCDTLPKAQPQSNLGVFLGLIHQVVTATEVTDSGQLRVEFAGGWLLLVQRIDGVAAWRLVVQGVGMFSVQGDGALMLPKGLSTGR